ncbi:MAG: hypothetical protein ACKOUM_05545 [Sphingopyxis sp.]
MNSPAAPSDSTVDTTRPASAGPRAPWPRWKWAAPIIAVVAIAYTIWAYPAWKAQARLGAAYGARVACSCRFVQGRDMASCTTDFEPGMESVSVEEFPDDKAVVASVTMLARRRAQLHGASGCLLDPDE